MNDVYRNSLTAITVAGLETNHFDKSKCQEAFEEYKACKKFEVTILTRHHNVMKKLCSTRRFSDAAKHKYAHWVSEAQYED